MEFNIFKSLIWKSRLKYNKKDAFIKIIQENYSNSPIQIPKDWKCTIHSSFDNKSEHIPKDLIKLIQDKCNQFLDLYVKDLKIFGEFYLNNCWYNAYTGDQFQEPHTHGNALFSGCYYLKFDKENHHQTEFYNPNFNLNYSRLESNNYFCFSPDCEEDDIIIFPAYLKHGTRGIKGNHNKLRITVSFNITNSSVCYEEQPKKYFSYQ